MYSISTTTCEYVGSTTNCITESPFFSNGDIINGFLLFLIFNVLFFISLISLKKWFIGY